MIEWSLVGKYSVRILGACAVTGRLMLFSVIFGIISAAILAFIRIKKIPILGRLMILHSVYVKNTPMIIQLFIVFYGLPVIFKGFDPIGSAAERLVCAVLALSLNLGVYLYDNIGKAVKAVPPGQRDAAYSVGMSEVQMLKRIVLPQAFRISIPGLSVIMKWLFHSTALVYLLGINDIMGKADRIGLDEGHRIESFVSVAFIFIAFTLVLEGFFRYLEKRFRYNGKTGLKDGEKING